MIFDQLKRDHEKMRGQMDKIVATVSPAQRAVRLKEFAEEFNSHSKAEEMFFYRAILRGEYGDDLTHDQALESLEDHIAMENALAEVEDTDPAQAAWMERFRFFRRSFERHMLEEEKVLFKSVRRLVPTDKAVELGEAFLDAKNNQSNSQSARLGR